MIPRIKAIKPQDNFILLVEFDDGKSVSYDVKSDIDSIPDFSILKTEYGLFENFELDASRTVISWSDRADLPSDTIYEYGTKIE